MKILDTINTRYQKLTKNEKRIFDLMSQDIKGFALQSIGEIAGQLEISKTTLMRFARNCGYSGYSEFKKALQKEALLYVSPAWKMNQMISDDVTLTIKDLVEQEMKNIETTFAGLNEKDLLAVTDMIVNKREINTLTHGVSGSIANIFGLRMKMIGIRCNAIRRNHGTLAEECSLLRKDDLVIIFELPPYATEVTEAVKLLKKKGCSIIAVTDSSRCPINEYADFRFYCATSTMLFGNCMSGQLFWVNLISHLVIYQRKDDVMEILKDHQSYYDDERFFHQAFPKLC